MASKQGSLIGPFWNDDANQHYWYDEVRDVLIRQDGREMSRPSSIPRRSLSSPLTRDGLRESASATKPVYVRTSASALRQQNRPFSSSSVTVDGVITQVEEVFGGKIIKASDPAARVSTHYRTGPNKDITDPALFQEGKRSARYLLKGSGSEGDTEHEFLTFEVVKSPRQFFTVGRVFAILWTEPRDGTLVTDIISTRSPTRGLISSKLRRFVVIREGSTYCSALRITTYSGEGVGKAGINKSEHAIIYCGKNAPVVMESEEPIRGELSMRPDPIRVDADDREDKLDQRSRLDFGKIYTVEHHIKVRSYGQVNQHSMGALVQQFNNCWHTPSTVSSSIAGAGTIYATNSALRRYGMGREQVMTSGGQSRSSSSGYQATRSSTTSSYPALASDTSEGTRAFEGKREAIARRQEWGREQYWSAVEHIMKHDHLSKERAVNIIDARLAQRAGARNQLDKRAADNGDTDDKDYADDDSGYVTTNLDRDHSKAGFHWEAPSSTISTQTHALDRPTKANASTNEIYTRRHSNMTDVRPEFFAAQLNAENLGIALDRTEYPSGPGDPKRRSANEGRPETLHVEAAASLPGLIPSAIDSIIQSFTDQITQDTTLRVPQGNDDNNTTILSDLIEHYASLLSYRAKKEEEKQAVSFVRTNCKDICTRIGQALLPNPGYTPQSRDPETTLQSKAERQVVNSGSIARHHQTTLAKYQSSFNAADHDSIEDDDNEVTTITNFLVTGAEYQWLLARIISILTMDQTAYRKVEAVRQEVLKAMASDVNVGGTQCAIISLRWEPLRYLKENFKKDVDIGDTIVIVGNFSKTYATTCRAYVSKLWQGSGLKVLDIVSRALRLKESKPQIQNDSMELQFWFDTAKTCVRVKAQTLEMCEAIEVLVWMATVCRSPSSSRKIDYCEPLITTCPSKVGEPDLAIAFESTTTLVHDNGSNSTQCWYAMFSGAVIGHGYPTPARSDCDKGMELSVEVLVALVEANTFQHYEGRMLLKGFNSMFAVSRFGRDTGTVQWHFIVSSEPSVRISYNDGLQFPEYGSPPPLQDLISEKYRHFVGWCHNAKVMAGHAVGVPVKINYSGLTDPGPALLVEKRLQFTLGQYVNVSVKATLGKREGPVQSRRQCFSDQMRMARDDMKVILSDVEHRQHWLFDGATFILYLTMAILDQEPTTDDNPNARTELKLPDGLTPRSAFDALLSHANRNIIWRTTANGSTTKGSTAKTVEDLFLQCYEVLEEYGDSLESPQKTMKVRLPFTNGRTIEGSEFRDVVESKRYKLRELALQPEAVPWIDWTRKLRTLNFFGTDFGELIHTSDSFHAKLCPLNGSMPTKYDLLAVPVQVLEKTVPNGGTHTRQSVNVADGFYWEEPDKSFTHCYFDAKSPRCISLIPSFSTKPSFHVNEQRRKAHHIFMDHPNGAIILGKRTDKVASSAVKDPSPQTLRGERLSMRPDANSGQENSKKFDETDPVHNRYMHALCTELESSTSSSPDKPNEVQSSEREDTSSLRGYGDEDSPSDNDSPTYTIALESAPTSILSDFGLKHSQPRASSPRSVKLVETNFAGPISLDPNSAKSTNPQGISKDLPRAAELRFKQVSVGAQNRQRSTYALTRTSMSTAGPNSGYVTSAQRRKGRPVENQA